MGILRASFQDWMTMTRILVAGGSELAVLMFTVTVDEGEVEEAYMTVLL